MRNKVRIKTVVAGARSLHVRPMQYRHSAEIGVPEALLQEPCSEQRFIPVLIEP